MLSQKAKYGLKALLYLVEHHERGGVSIGEIAREQKIPRKFLDVILLELKKQGFLDSRMGKNGGYWLDRPATAITIGAILRTLDGPLAPIPCASRTAYKPCPDCADVETCPIRRAMLEARDAMASVLDGMTLAQMAGDGGATLEALIYNI